jgi:hypothetical protein
VQEARNLINRISGATGVQIYLPRRQGLNEYPVLMRRARVDLQPLIRAFIILKSAGFKPFTIRVRWNATEGELKLTLNEIQTAAQRLASEFLRGLVENSNGRLQNNDFVINAQGAIVVEPTSQGLTFNVIVP